MCSRRVEESPTEENPYHADIILPGMDRKTQEEHAQLLADCAKWLAHPNETENQEPGR